MLISSIIFMPFMSREETHTVWVDLLGVPSDRDCKREGEREEGRER